MYRLHLETIIIYCIYILTKDWLKYRVTGDASSELLGTNCSWMNFEDKKYYDNTLISHVISKSSILHMDTVEAAWCDNMFYTCLSLEM